MEYTKEGETFLTHTVSKQEGKLGICVVYVADADFEWMVDLQLRAIDAFTRDTDFTLYAALPRGDAAVRKSLEKRPFVEIVDTPTTTARKAAEHAHHLEHLVEHAKQKGCSFIATFDSDSFPVNTTWFQKLSSSLSDTTPLVAVSRTEIGDFGLPHPCGMMFTVDFHNRFHPRFLPPNSKKERRIRKKYNITRDTGIGYALALKRANLDWIQLQMTARPPGNLFCGTVYGDMIFHFGGGVRLKTLLSTRERFIEYLYKKMKWLPVLRRNHEKFLARRIKMGNAERARVERQLRDDPDSFLSDLVGRKLRLVDLAPEIES